jgi:homoserine dehydrogenase
MKQLNLALLGFGNVGRAFAALLQEKAGDIREQYRAEFSVVGIMTGRHGMVLNDDGVDMPSAIELAESGRSLDVLNPAGNTLNSHEFIRACGAHILLENTPVNYVDGQPAVSHIEEALRRGMHVITANKGPVVHAYREIKALAESRDLHFRFESTVMDGAPIFSLWRECLPAARLIRFRGVLNSTSNLILTRMEWGETFDDAVRYAQQIGVAETDPAGDIDGWDAAVKVAALINVLMDVPVRPADIQPTGIRQLSLSDIETARREGKRWKLVCEAERRPETVHASVQPRLIGVDDPLYAVSGTSSAITFETDVLGDLTVFETDPGPMTTAYGLLADLLGLIKPG